MQQTLAVEQQMPQDLWLESASCVSVLAEHSQAELVTDPQTVGDPPDSR